ncbi:MAG: lysine biosynthesis protein LysX [Chloroflexota bacterium]|jgi:[lysine-biosynthesis-protein LysW]--L-2-aminoadipate ligase|nr:lysine biosynthesis protein LysX [Chloroflexota bacterium]
MSLSFTPLKLGILVSYLRQEEKLILAAARARGIDVVPLFDRDLALNLSAPTARESGVDIDVLLDRSVVHSRAGYTLHAMARWGIPTLNSAAAVTICDDKARASMVLEAAGIPSPKTYVAYSANAAIEACEALGYPAVLKPVTGSWGRLLAKVNGPEQARAIIAQKAEHGSFHHEIFYVQEFIEKPGRDIRAYVIGREIVAASYRMSEHWITNAAKGAVSVPCEVTPEIEELALRACDAVGARLAGVDLIETDQGLKVIEINTGGEFKGLMTTTNRDIAGEIVEEAMRVLTGSADPVSARA